jgi:hypothetical protein
VPGKGRDAGHLTRSCARPLRRRHPAGGRPAVGGPELQQPGQPDPAGPGPELWGGGGGHYQPTDSGADHRGPLWESPGAGECQVRHRHSAHRRPVRGRPGRPVSKGHSNDPEGTIAASLGQLRSRERAPDVPQGAVPSGRQRSPAVSRRSPRPASVPSAGGRTVLPKLAVDAAPTISTGRPPSPPRLLCPRQGHSVAVTVPAAVTAHACLPPAAPDGRRRSALPAQPPWSRPASSHRRSQV